MGLDLSSTRKYVGREVLSEHIIGLLFLAGVSRPQLRKLGFSKKHIVAVTRNNEFLLNLKNVLALKTFQFALLSRMYGIKEDLLPMPYLYLQLFGIEPIRIMSIYFPNIVIQPVKIEPLGLDDNVRRWIKNRRNFLRRLPIYAKNVKKRGKKHRMGRIRT